MRTRSTRFFSHVFSTLFVALLCSTAVSAPDPGVGVGAKPPPGADVLIDGSRETLDAKWIYWEGPGFKSALPIKWKIVEDPVDSGTVVSTHDPAAEGGKYGAADIVTKKEYRDFRLHVEFLVMKPGGNSGVYLQNVTKSRCWTATRPSTAWVRL